MSLGIPVTPRFALTPGRDGAAASVHEMETARHVQQHLFPRDLPRVPGWDWAGLCRPARGPSPATITTCSRPPRDK
jgi:hypothetical protein